MEYVEAVMAIQEFQEDIDELIEFEIMVRELSTKYAEASVFNTSPYEAQHEYAMLMTFLSGETSASLLAVLTGVVSRISTLQTRMGRLSDALPDEEVQHQGRVR